MQLRRVGKPERYVEVKAYDTISGALDEAMLCVVKDVHHGSSSSSFLYAGIFLLGPQLKAYDRIVALHCTDTWEIAAVLLLILCVVNSLRVTDISC